MYRQKLAILSLVAIFNIAQFTVISHALADDKKVTICHAAGQDGTLHYNTLEISENALYGKNGNAGHFDENGTPAAGHENDYMGACRTNSDPIPSTAPSADPTATPTATPTPTPTSTPTSTIASSTNTNNSNSQNNSGNNSNNSSSSNNPSNPEGQILGDYAATGVATDVMMNMLGGVGTVLTTIGTFIYGKNKKA